MKIRIFLFALLSAAGLFAQISISPGAKMPEIEALWITEKPVELPAIPAKGQHILSAVVFVDLMRPDTIQVLRMTERVAAEYAVCKTMTVRIVTVANNSPEDVQKFLQANKFVPRVALGTDKGKKTFNAFSISSTPFAFIAKDGAVLWSGHPVNLEYVVESSVKGTFSQASFKQLLQMRRDMQSAIHAGLFEVAAKTAEKALEVFPTDMLALQTRLYAFQQRGRYKDAVVFLEKHLKKHPSADRPEISLLLLDLIIRSSDYSNWTRNVSEAIRKTAGKPEKELNLAAFLLTRPPMVKCPVKEVLLLSGNAVRGLEKTNQLSLYADALEISARANHMACRLDEAIRLQENAVRVRLKNKDAGLLRTQEMLKYYLALKKIR